MVMERWSVDRKGSPGIGQNNELQGERCTQT